MDQAREHTEESRAAFARRVLVEYLTGELVPSTDTEQLAEQKLARLMAKQAKALDEMQQLLAQVAEKAGPRR